MRAQLTLKTLESRETLRGSFLMASTVVKFRAKAQTSYPSVKVDSVFAPIDRGASPSRQASDHHGVDHFSPRLLREYRPHLPPSRLYPGCLFGSPTVETQNPCQPPLNSAQARATGGTWPQKRKTPEAVRQLGSFFSIERAGGQVPDLVKPILCCSDGFVKPRFLSIENTDEIEPYFQSFVKENPKEERTNE